MLDACFFEAIMEYSKKEYGEDFLKYDPEDKNFINLANLLMNGIVYQDVYQDDGGEIKMRTLPCPEWQKFLADHVHTHCLEKDKFNEKIMEGRAEREECGIRENMLVRLSNGKIVRSYRCVRSK